MICYAGDLLIFNIKLEIMLSNTYKPMHRVHMTMIGLLCTMMRNFTKLSQAVWHLGFLTGRQQSCSTQPNPTEFPDPVPVNKYDNI